MCNVAGVAPLRKRHGSAVTVSRAADCSNILPLLAHGAAAENGGWSAAVCAMHQAQRIKVTATVRPHQGRSAAALYRRAGDDKDSSAWLLPPGSVC